MSQAIISIEDRRFYDHHGDRLPGIGRAVGRGRSSSAPAPQGASTSTQQFVKNALAASHTERSSRSCARRRSPTTSRRKWSKRKILSEYLNSIYFGNGAYGIESAARVYFSYRHPGCDQDAQRPCASALTAASPR